MSLLTIAPVEQCGIDPDRWDSAMSLARRWTEGGSVVPAIAILVGHHGQTPGPQLFGNHRIEPESPPIRDDSIFLVASITKPVVAMGAMLLIDRGQLALNDRISDVLPGFGKKGKYGTTIRHLLTHTSGLPDMLPNNMELRRSNSDLARFVAEISLYPPDFPPGRSVQYQSMGFAVLAAVIEQITGESCAEFLYRQLFVPNGMRDTRLGAPSDWFEGNPPMADRIAQIRLASDQTEAIGWNWNSRYWRQLGAPWGGLLSTPWDLGLFAQLMLNQGRSGNQQLISAASVVEATTNQFSHMKDVPDEDRRFRPWGLGWRLQWPSHANSFGDLVSSSTYGHWGATGTLLWIDPRRQLFVVILTTEPQDPKGAPLQKLSNAIVAALV